MTLRLTFVLALAVAVGGCDGFEDDDFTAQVVVSATLGAGEPLPPVALSESAPLLDVYDPDARAVGGATVTVTLLAADGSPERVYPYREVVAGRYLADTDDAAMPGRTYRLDVRAGDATLTAQTTVPPAISLVEPPAETTVYGTGQGPEVRITQTSTAARQSAFVTSTRALAPVDFVEVEVDGETRYRSVPEDGRFGLTSPYERFLGCDREPDGVTLVCDFDPSENAIVGTSPVINEASYIPLGDGTVLVQVPYLAFGFFGPVQISLVSLDPALEAFVESQLVQGGGSTLSPGEIPNVTSNVEGGLGVFGSFARVIAQTTLVEP
ncbi:DUF4249 family protein [Rubrivirga sp.]|uniref:DUF4249 family protein n=1 Tax=Rubrivirga sp. TaxID=1885344 RepID=UPI003B5279A0